MKHLPPTITTAAVLLTIATLNLAAQSPAKLTKPRSFGVTVTGTGQPMILIPGLESSGEVWSGVVEHFQSHYRIHVLTLAGFAGQPPIPGLHLADVKSDILKYIRDQHMDRPVIAGHSLGGFLALWVASSAPDVPSRVISVDGVPFLPALMDPSATLDSAKAGAEKIRTMYASMKPEQMAGASKMSLSYMIGDPGKINVATEWAARSDPAFVAQALYDLMTTDLRDDMSKIRVPVLLIGAGKAFAGDPDRLAAAQKAYASQVSKVPDGKVLLASNALHFIMFDDPQFLLRAMDDFLSAGGRPDAH